MPGELGFDTGPFINVAVFCERALQEADGTLSLIRLMDQIHVTAAGPEAPAEMPEGTAVQTTLVVSLKPGEARGSVAFRVVLKLPSGTQRPGPEMSVPFAGGSHQGVNIILPMQFKVEELGLYWADIFVAERLMTRVPLHINYQYVRGPTNE